MVAACRLARGASHFETIGGVQHTIIEGNVRTVGGNDTTIDFQIDLLGQVTLTSADFILGGP